MGYNDLRQFLQVAESNGELKRISGANWDLEMSSIAELVYREGKEPRPVLLFDDIPGYPKGYRTLFGLLATARKVAHTLGLPEDQTDGMSLMRNWREKAKGLRMIPPKVVTSGPVLANSDTGDKVDILKFPVPRFHELDTKRFIGTCHGVITKDPDTGWVNIGTYRNMVFDRNRLGLHWSPARHGKIVMEEKYFARGKVMPVAIALGIEPILWWVSTNPGVPWGTSEYDYAGGITGKPLEVIEGPYTGLPLPAHAEIVIEGECHPGELDDEGPFGEWHGYYSNQGLLTVPEQVIRVKAIHYRDDPILTCAQVTVPPHDSSLILSLAVAMEIWSDLEAMGVPGIQGVWCHEIGCGKLFNVISIKQLYPGHSRLVGLVASQIPTAFGRYTIVIEEDIDPTNLEQVMWAVVTRALPDRSIQVLEHCRASNVDTAIPLEEKRKAPEGMALTSSRVFIDGCREWSWKKDWYPIARVSPELRTQILDKWQSTLSELL